MDNDVRAKFHARAKKLRSPLLTARAGTYSPVPMVDLTEKVAQRNGIGDVLAEGAARTGAHFGHPEIAMTVKGQALAAYEPRGMKGMGLSYATSNRGACHLRAYVAASELSVVPITADPLEYLPGAATEADQAGELFERSLVLTGTDAGEDAIKRSPLADTEILHVAAHGHADERDVRRSFLVLNPAPDAAAGRSGPIRSRIRRFAGLRVVDQVGRRDGVHRPRQPTGTPQIAGPGGRPDVGQPLAVDLLVAALAILGAGVGVAGLLEEGRLGARDAAGGGEERRRHGGSQTSLQRRGSGVPSRGSRM